MSMHITIIKRSSALALFVILAFTVSSAMAQTSPAATAAAPAEGSPVVSHPATTGPISHNYTLKKVDGTLNILVNSDGTWNFSDSTSKAFRAKTSTSRWR